MATARIIPKTCCHSSHSLSIFHNNYCNTEMLLWELTSILCRESKTNFKKDVDIRVDWNYSLNENKCFHCSVPSTKCEWRFLSFYLMFSVFFVFFFSNLKLYICGFNKTLTTWNGQFRCEEKCLFNICCLAKVLFNSFEKIWHRVLSLGCESRYVFRMCDLKKNVLCQSCTTGYTILSVFYYS